jgi:glutathione S-transferase
MTREIDEMTNPAPNGEPTLYYSPGSCALASHIALEEAGKPYRSIETLLANKAHLTPEYLAINPRGKVPALVVERQVITENTAILTYIASTNPELGLLPADPIGKAQCISQMAWFSNTPHIFQRAKFRPYYFVDNEDLFPDVQAKAAATYWTYMQEIDAALAGRKWMMGDGYTVADPYAIVFYGWGVSNGMPMEQLKDFTRHKNQMIERPAVKVVLEREKNPHIR